METMKAIAQRKSTRAFGAAQIPEDALQAILSAGCAAPVGGSKYESYHLTVIQDAGMLKRISESVSKEIGVANNPLYGAPTLIVISASDEPMAFGIDYADSACIATTMLLAATDHGIGSVYLWGACQAIKSDPAMKRELGIPANYRPLASVALGNPIVPDAREKDLRITIACNRL